MKKILIALLFIWTASSVYAQDVTLVQGTTDQVTYNLSSNLHNVFITIQDTGATYTDSIHVYAIFSNPYRKVLTTAVEQETRKMYTTLIPGPGNVKGYNLPTLGATRLSFEFANVEEVEDRRTIITVKETGSTIGFGVIERATYDSGRVAWFKTISDSATGMTQITMAGMISVASYDLYNFGADTIWFNHTGNKAHETFPLVPGASYNNNLVNLPLYAYKRSSATSSWLIVYPKKY